MSLPQSFIRDGFGPTPKPKFRRLLIGTEGEASSGKSEFIASAPGPGIVLCLDRNHEAMLENPHPPKARRDDFAFKIIPIPLDTQVTKNQFLESWQSFKALAYKALGNADARTIGIDTDNASWELQQLADFGKLTQIPPIMRTGVNAARRAFIAKLSDSGKNIIATNMLKDEWATVVDESGKPVLSKDGKDTQEKTGERKRQGFGDQNYLWQVQLRHLVKPAEVTRVPGKIKMVAGKLVKSEGEVVRTPTQFGIRILKCTRNSEMVGEELWGNSCNFAGLVKLIYPESNLTEWGF